MFNTKESMTLLFLSVCVFNAQSAFASANNGGVPEGKKTTHQFSSTHGVSVLKQKFETPQNTVKNVPSPKQVAVRGVQKLKSIFEEHKDTVKNIPAPQKVAVEGVSALKKKFEKSQNAGENAVKKFQSPQKIVTHGVQKLKSVFETSQNTVKNVLAPKKIAAQGVNALKQKFEKPQDAAHNIPTPQIQIDSKIDLTDSVSSLLTRYNKHQRLSNQDGETECVQVIFKKLFADTGSDYRISKKDVFSLSDTQLINLTLILASRRYDVNSVGEVLISQKEKTVEIVDSIMDAVGPEKINNFSRFLEENKFKNTINAISWLLGHVEKLRKEWISSTYDYLQEQYEALINNVPLNVQALIKEEAFRNYCDVGGKNASVREQWGALRRDSEFSGPFYGVLGEHYQELRKQQFQRFFH